MGSRAPDILALMGGAIVVSVGGYFAFNGDSVALNRAGSMLIVIGVVLASIHYNEYIKKTVLDRFYKDHRSTMPKRLALKRSIKAMEVYFVIVGALLSAFGDWLIDLVQHW